MAPAPIDPSISAKTKEIQALPYAKYVIDEATIERVHGYKIVRNQISAGKNTIVYKCEKYGHPETYCLIKNYQFGKDRIKESFSEETCQILRFVSGKSPKLLSTFDIFYTNEKLYLMCDWSAKGDVLSNLRRKKVALNEVMLRNWAVDITNGLAFLHSNGIAHRNLAPGSLLLTQDDRVKIGILSDCVLYTTPDGALVKKKWTKFSRGTNWNQPPEVAKGKAYDPRRADIWSFGATLLWFATSQHPINYRSSTKLTKQLEHNLANMRKISNKGQTFIKRLLSYQPSQRPSIGQVAQLEWVSSGGETSPGNTEETSKEIQHERVIDPADTTGTDEAGIAPETSVDRTNKQASPSEDVA